MLPKLLPLASLQSQKLYQLIAMHQNGVNDVHNEAKYHSLQDEDRVA